MSILATDMLRFWDLALYTGARRVQRGGREIDQTSTGYGLLHQSPAAYDFGGNTNTLRGTGYMLREE